MILAMIYKGTMAFGSMVGRMKNWIAHDASVIPLLLLSKEIHGWAGAPCSL
jgi:hypothetical protein